MSTKNGSAFIPHVTPMAAWALALGTTIGWGSLVVTCNSYLSQGGPAGSVAGLLIGAVVMLAISRNYHYMINCYPECGGAYAFTREAFGYDMGFLTAWFLVLTYLAVFWANATSLPLFARYFIGNVFRFGYLYTIFGYDVFLGEALLTIAAIILIALLCMKQNQSALRAMVGMCVLLALGITVCFAVAMAGHSFSFEPAFIPDKKAISQVVRIAGISAWAFIGFENISHLTEEYTFPRKRVFGILSAAVITATVLYIFVMLLSISAYPDRYGSWLEYIRDLGNLSGIEGLPAFYAARHYMGGAGVVILMITLLCLVLTSLIGNLTALSRLFVSLGKDKILPERFGEISSRGTPEKAMILIAALSCIIPFFGRTAIGWIVDVTTLGATMIYGLVSAAVFKTARIREDTPEIITGMAGVLIMIAFGAYLLLPNLFTGNTMEPESFFLFVAWSVIGFLYFHTLLRKDQDRKFGQSIVVWISLLSLVLFISLVWMNQSTMNATTRAINNIQGHYAASGEIEEDAYVMDQLRSARSASTRSILTVIFMFGISLGTLLSNFSLMKRKVEESEAELVRVKNKAHTDPLTGVKSKQAYAEREKEVNEAIAEGVAGPFAVGICDVNGLKHINDTYGHKAGDEYIRAACAMVCDIFKHSPVFRIGGDEFMILMTGRDYDNRDALMKELHDRSLANIGTDNVVVSGGASTYLAGRDNSLHDVFERADALMYEEKKALKSLGARTR